MNDLVKSEPKNEIVVYQPNETMRLEVRIENDTAWLSRQQMARLFGRDVKTIGKHVANALKEELAPLVAKSATSDVIPMNPVVAKFATTAADGKTYQVERANGDRPQRWGCSGGVGCCGLGALVGSAVW